MGIRSVGSYREVSDSPSLSLGCASPGGMLKPVNLRVWPWDVLRILAVNFEDKGAEASFISAYPPDGQGVIDAIEG